MTHSCSQSTPRAAAVFLGGSLAIFLVTFAFTARAGTLFESDGMLDVELRAPLTSIYAQRKQDVRDEMPGTWHYQNVGGEEVTLDVGVRTRGNFRRHHCFQAPLRLKFRKKQVDGTLFEGERKLKLVSPCRKGGRFEEIIAAEYFVYKIYELLSDYHFRVRPLNITFVDTDRDDKPRTEFAFLIEDMDDMAGRYGRVVPDWERTEFRDLEPQQLALVDVFQFMIGGHDWSVVAAAEGQRCCHNSRLLTVPGETTNVVPVPYDFDLTGIVNAPYAFPPESIPIDNVRQRYFRGRCKSNALWRATFERFRAQRAAIFALYDAPPASKRLRNKSRKYLEQFYRILDDPDRLQRMVYEKCQPIP